MINIYQVNNAFGIDYFFTTPFWFSSNFDSLQQLIEVGLDDPDKGEIDDSMNIHLDPLYDDCTLLCTIEEFEDLYDYPELLI